MPVRPLREQDLDDQVAPEPPKPRAPVKRLSRAERERLRAAAEAGEADAPEVVAAAVSATDQPSGEGAAAAAPTGSPAATRSTGRARRRPAPPKASGSLGEVPDFGDLVRGTMRPQAFTIPGVIVEAVSDLQERADVNFPQAFLLRGLVVLQLQKGGLDRLVERLAEYMIWIGEQRGNTTAEPVVMRLHNGTVDAITRANNEMNPGRSGARRYKSSIVAALVWEQLRRVDDGLDGLLADLRAFAVAEQIARMKA